MGRWGVDSLVGEWFGVVSERRQRWGAAVTRGLACSHLLVSLAAAQSAALSLGTGSGADGEDAVVSASVSSDVAIDGFAFGVVHPPTELTLLNITAGAAIDPAQGGVDPDFLNLNPNPPGGPGALVGCIVRFALDLQLAPNTLHSVIDLAYRVAPGSGAGTSVLSFSSLLGDPTIDVMVVSGLVEMFPTLSSGSIERLGMDCNGNGVPDAEDITLGTSADCDGNGLPDECDLAAGTLIDCDGDLVPDSCAIAQGAVLDCDANLIPDSCQIAAGTASDCDLDGEMDSCEIAAGTATDCDLDGVPDTCELVSGTEEDCNSNGLPDTCDIMNGAPDCDSNGQIDSCEISAGTATDCDIDGVIDSCAIAGGTALDCDTNAVPDSCDIASGAADCDTNGALDACQITAGTALDCDLDGVIDSCAIASASVPDCDTNGIPDSCDIAGGAQDLDLDGIPDICQLAGPNFLRTDCNADGNISIADPIFLLAYLFVAGPPSTCLSGCDFGDDGALDISDAISSLTYQFVSGAPPLAPFPGCGPDPTPGGPLDCVDHPACP